MRNETRPGTQHSEPQLQLKEADIIQIIIDDHKALKELIEVMKDSDRETAVRFGAFTEFATTLTAHAKPEEEVLYADMKNETELRKEAFEGDVEHHVADQLVEKIKRTSDEDLKLARIKVLAEIVERHIEEEEGDLLPKFRKHSSTQVRAELGNRFLERKLKYLSSGSDQATPSSKAPSAKH